MLLKNKQNKLSDDEFSILMKECSISEIKTMIYRKMKIPEVQGEEPFKTVLKAYLTMIEDQDWYQEVLNIQNMHKKIVYQISEGKKIANLNEDPML